MLTRAQKEEKVAELREKLGRATSLYVADYRGVTVEAVNRLRSRVRRGEYAEAARGLSKAVLRRGSIDDTEAYVLLAVAAKHSGRGRDLIEARAVAKERGADLSALD